MFTLAQGQGLIDICLTAQLLIRVGSVYMAKSLACDTRQDSLAVSKSSSAAAPERP